MGSHLESSLAGDARQPNAAVHAYHRHVRIHTHVLAVAAACVQFGRTSGPHTLGKGEVERRCARADSPMSAMIDPFGTPLTNASMRGHGLYRVWLKCGAMVSATTAPTAMMPQQCRACQSVPALPHAAQQHCGYAPYS